MSQILEIFLSSGVLIPGLTLGFGFYIGYLLLAARNVVPITTDEVETLWKFHKQKDWCKSKTWHEIIKNNKLVGFECQCGHRHIQKKPLITIN